MYRIKLLILLLISQIFISCSNNSQIIQKNKYSVDYISGEYDGLVLKNLLINNLKSVNLYNPQAKYLIKSEVIHSYNIYITNIDNTSDRERVTTNLDIDILDRINDCKVLSWNESISQFYIFASGEKQISNKTANQEIKRNNTEELVKQFLNDLISKEHYCE